jgi:putative redox protein
MSKMHIEYMGQLRIKATHYSGAELMTDAPVDNQGKGESFSPTDLLCTALGTCMVTIMGIRAAKLNVPYEGLKAEVLKYMSLDLPRRVIKVKVKIDMPANIKNAPERAEIEQAGLECPVALSLHPNIEQDIEFIYP